MVVSVWVVIILQNVLICCTYFDGQPKLASLVWACESCRVVCGAVCGADAGGTLNELSWEIITDIACATSLTVIWRACKLFAILFCEAWYWTNSWVTDCRLNRSSSNSLDCCSRHSARWSPIVAVRED